MGQLLLGLAPSRPIEASVETDLIEFGLDGRVYDNSKTTYITKPCEERAKRIERTHAN